MATSKFMVPLVYRIVFLVVEPIFTLLGAFVAHFKPLEYLQLTHAASAPATPDDVSLVTDIVLTQLANLYLLFGISEALILRSTSDLRVWRAVLIGFLIADFGHLYSVRSLGPDVYWKITQWNSMDFGNVGLVYALASLRIAFLCGIGLKSAIGQGDRLASSSPQKVK